MVWPRKEDRHTAFLAQSGYEDAAGRTGSARSVRRTGGSIKVDAGCDDAWMHRLWLRALCALLGMAAPALAATSSAQLWTALHGSVTCGVAIHPYNSPPMQLLCSARPVPAPRANGVGDPGFVFLGSTGRPSLARLSQDSFVGTKAVALRTGRSWSIGPISVTCTVSASAVRCANRSHHGFRITKRSYRAF